MNEKIEMNSVAQALKAGDRITWNDARQGGEIPVPAMFVKHGLSRVQIEFMEPVPFTRNHVRRQKWVNADSVEIRFLPCVLLGEDLTMEYKGFSLTGVRHPARGHALYPNGLFYGNVDGYPATAPCSSEENALHHAYQALVAGGYAVALRSAIELYERWLNTVSEQKNIDEANRSLPDLRARLQKLRDAGLTLKTQSLLGA